MNPVVLQEYSDFVSSARPQEDLDLLTRHDLYFETRSANNPALINAVHTLRYQVYCLERKFERTEDHANGTEIDAFDSHSMHGLLFYRPTGEAMGTVRIISSDNGKTQDSLPIIGLLRENGINLADYVPIADTVEISRFAISKQLRRRLTDQFKSTGISAPRFRFERERSGNLPCLSLMQFIVRQSRELGASHWAAVMEIKLLRMLASMGIHFQPIGPIVLHHGLRQPCYGKISDVLEAVRKEHYDHWSVITNAGESTQKL